MPTNIGEIQTHRLPLIVTEYSRPISSASTSSTTSGIVGVGVVGLMVVGRLAGATKDQRLVNAIPEKIKNPLTGAESFFVMKRPGWDVLQNVGTGVGSAIHVWAGKSPGTAVISAFGDPGTAYNGTSSLGTATDKIKFINDTLLVTTPTLTFIADDNTAYYYPDGGVWTTISDGDFPGNAGETLTGNFAFLNGYTFIMTQSGRIYNSDLNSLSAWGPTDYLSANMMPDRGIGLARYKDQIVAFGSESIQFFSNVENQTGSPLQVTSQGFINIGCINENAYVQCDDTVAWVGSTAASGIGLYMLEGLNAKKVSTPTIEALLATTETSHIYLNTIKLIGKTFLVLVATNIATTYVYCVEDNIWHEWSGPSILWQHIKGVSTNIKYAYAVSEQTLDGNVYYIDPTSFVFTDDGQTYPFVIQTSRWDLDNQKRKFLRKLRLVGDIEEGSTPISVSWSDDDYNTFSTARTVDMEDSDAVLNACGSFRRRAFSISNTSDGPLRLHGIELDVVQGIH